MQNIQAVIFDLDGTLLNTLDDLTDSTNEMLRFYGYPEHTVDEVRQFVGNGLPVLAELAIPGGKSNPKYEEALAKLRDCYAHNWKNKTRPYDGVIDMMKILAARNQMRHRIKQTGCTGEGTSISFLQRRRTSRSG